MGRQGPRRSLRRRACRMHARGLMDMSQAEDRKGVVGSLLDNLAAVVGDRHVIAAGSDQEPCVVDWRGRCRGRACAVVKPGSTQEVAAVVKLCAG
jgi:hypothetical protein